MARKLRRLPKIETRLYEDEFYHQPGTIPGTIIIDEDSPSPIIFLIDYNQTNFIREQMATPEECIPYLEMESISWVDVQGLGRVFKLVVS